MWWKRKQQDFGDEIEAHIKLEADELRSEGLAPAEAHSSAQRAFGNRTAAQERFYEASRWMLLSHLIRDIRFAARVLIKDLRFSSLAVLGLALGIGVSTAIFTLILTVIQFEDRAALVSPGSYVALLNRTRDTDLSYSAFRYYRQHSTAFSAMNAESGRWEFVLNPMASGAAAEDVEGRFESADFLAVIGFHPALGRSFSKAEEEVGGPLVTVLNFAFWQRRFSGDPAVLGRTIVLNNHAVTIIGVADERFAYADEAAFYLPLELQPLLSGRGDLLRAAEATWVHVDARLRSGVTLPQAQAEIDVLSSSLDGGKPAGPATGGVSLLPGGGNPQKQREFVAAAFAAILSVSMILLIACSNLANLLLARAAVRHREIGVRLSLGASRARLICQLLTESMLLATAGGALGLLFSFWLARWLFVLYSPLRGVAPHLSPRVLLYGVLLTLATGFSFGLAPALAATRTNLARALHAQGLSGASGSTSRQVWSSRNLLVIVPLAVSLMLLMGAGLTVRLIQRMYFGGPAFDTSHLIGVDLRLKLQGYDEARTLEFQENLRQRLATMPGVSSVALATTMPLSNGTGWFPLITEGSAIVTGPGAPSADYNVVSAGFFDTVGARVVRGRPFAPSDREGSAPVALVNQALVRKYWPNDEPVGKHIRFAAGSTFFEVIGVAPDLEDADVPVNSVWPTVYVPYGQGKLLLAGDPTGAPRYQVQFLVRTSNNPAAWKPALRQAALAADPSLWVNVQTLDERLEQRTGPLKIISSLLSGLGALALIMAAVGIYAILAYAVSQRTREIGIRMALGAKRREILALVMQRTAGLIAWGIGAGLLGALALSRILASSLRKIGALDAMTCLVVSVLLGTVAMFASYLPARKALRVDPAEALRSE